jgi:hypothetical protein
MPRLKSDQYLDSYNSHQRSSSPLVSVSLHLHLNEIRLKSPHMVPIPITLNARNTVRKVDGDLHSQSSYPLDRDLLHLCGRRSDVRVSTKHLQGQEAALHNRHWRLAPIPRLASEMQNLRTIPPEMFRHLSGEANDGRVALCVSQFGYCVSCKLSWNTTSNFCSQWELDMVRSHGRWR